MKLHIVLFSGRHMPDVIVTHCLKDSFDDLRKAGIEYEFNSICGSSILPAARNMAVTEFLKSDCTDLVMLDDDIGWEVGALTRLAKHPVDVVGGIYPAKLDPETYLVRWDYAKPMLVGDPVTGLLEMEAVPTGFLKISRKCLEAMREHYKELAYHDDSLKETSHALFDFELRDHRYWGEDFTFCRRWREIGGKVWCDPEMTFFHVGRKTFKGHLGNWLRGRDDFEDAKSEYLKAPLEFDIAVPA
jgi:hypothetical protein